MRVTVVSDRAPSMLARALLDLGCTVRELALAQLAPALPLDGAMAVVDAGDDGALGGALVRTIRAASPRTLLVLGLARGQLSRLDPAWGHDDFVVTPVEPHELYARLRAVEWRASEFAQAERIKVGALVLDLSAREASVAGARLTLAKREFELLVYLAARRGRVVRRDELLARLFGVRRVGATRSLDVHVRRLRVKLGPSAPIETVRGVGYKLVAVA